MARQPFITADSGGSNSAVSRVWKAKLQEFSDRTGLTIEVSHFPPGTSKWNKIEHRLFSFVTLNWRGRPLINYETVVSLIAATKTSKGLEVAAVLDRDPYPVGDGVSRHHFAQLALVPGAFCGKWNYTIAPRNADAIHRASMPTPRRPRAAENWLPIITDQVASGLNSARFCAKHGINYEAFICARRKAKGLLRPKASRARRNWLAKIQYERALAK